MLQKTKSAVDGVSRGVKFFTRQERDWKVSVTRTNLTVFLYQMALPYLSIYIMALGATGTELGIVNSIGMAVAGIIGPFAGWLIDKTGVKKVYLIGIAILAMSYLIYGLAQSWTIIIIAMVAYYLGNFTSVQGCAVICANCLKSNERVTGMSICETFGMGLLGLIAPMIGAWLVTLFGGVNVDGIRPLFFVCLGGIIILFLLILNQLSNRNWGATASTGLNLFQNYASLFKEVHNLKRWLAINSISALPMFVIVPFIQPFAHDFKGADQFILGAMVTASAVMPLFLGVPFGRLADRIGRKKVIYTAIPLIWVSYIMLIFAPNSVFLVIAGAFQGFMAIAAITTEAMSREIVTPEQMGRWIGIVTFFRMCVGALMIYLAGVIWDKVGPQYVFVVIIALDIVRLALLKGVPETLRVKA